MTKIKEGMAMKFIGYKEEVEEPYFEAGDEVIVECIMVTETVKGKPVQKSVKSFDTETDTRPFSVCAFKEDNEDDVDTLYFPGEIDFLDDEEDEVEEEEEVEPKAKTKAKRTTAAPTTKTKVVEPVEEDDIEDEEAFDEEEEVEEEPAPAKKTKKASVEAAPAPKTKKVVAKAEVEEVEEQPKTKVKAKTKAKAVQEEEEVVEEKKVSKKKQATKKSTTKKAPSRTQEEEEQQEVQHSKSVEDLLADQDALDAAKSLVLQGERTFLSLGGVLCEIRAKKTYITAGYAGKKGFEEYVEQELNTSYRIALFYMTIYNTLLPLGVDEDVIVKVGYSKMKEICAYANEETIDDLMDLACSGITRDELISTVRASYVKAKDGEAGEKVERIKKVTYKFELFQDKADLVGAAMDRAKKLNGSSDNNEAFAAIITEWADMTEGVEVKLEDAITMLEKKYGVTLEVIDEEDEE